MVKKSRSRKAAAGGPPTSKPKISGGSARGFSATSVAAALLLVLACALGLVAIVQRSQLMAWTTPTLAWLPLAAAALGLILLPNQKGLRVTATVIVLLAVLLPVLLSPAQYVGDAGEYFQMMTSFSNH